jgi:hypothetical protein
MKTLGQINMDAIDAAFTGPLTSFSVVKNDLFEAGAQAVRAAVIRECITVLQKRYMGDLNREDQEVLRCIADLEAMKAKQ